MHFHPPVIEMEFEEDERHPGVGEQTAARGDMILERTRPRLHQTRHILLDDPRHLAVARLAARNLVVAVKRRIAVRQGDLRAVQIKGVKHPVRDDVLVVETDVCAGASADEATQPSADPRHELGPGKQQHFPSVVADRDIGRSVSRGILCHQIPHVLDVESAGAPRDDLRSVRPILQMSIDPDNLFAR